MIIIEKTEKLTAFLISMLILFLIVSAMRGQVVSALSVNGMLYTDNGDKKIGDMQTYINTNYDSPKMPTATVATDEERSIAIKNFQEAFCANGAKPNYTVYVTEYVLPQTCEMPLGIAVDDQKHKVWYVSTKEGHLGSYDLEKRKFDREYVIPEWASRLNPLSYSQVWDMKVDTKGSGDIWFTDAVGNAIWKYMPSTHLFEVFKIPDNFSPFGTAYPVSIQFDSKNKSIFFVGTFSPSIWIGDKNKMRNGTSDGIYQVQIPINNTFKGIDPIHIATGSAAYDSKRNSLWISILAYGTKGEIFRYNLGTKTFEIFDLPKGLNSPVGLVLDNSDNLWVTNAGSSIFYKLDPRDNKITEFVTSIASPRVYGVSSNNNYTENAIENQHNNTTSEASNKNAYTLPYWIQLASDGSLWFNEQEGNMVARFNPHTLKLIEYWIPTQNRIWGNCPNISKYNTDNSSSSSGSYVNIAVTLNLVQQQSCGIANVLQFSIHDHRQVWFSEWSENKIGKIEENQNIPFSIETKPNKDLTVKRGETYEIIVYVGYSNGGQSRSHNNQSSVSYISTPPHLIVSGSFTPTGHLGNSSGFFDKQISNIQLHKKGKVEEVHFYFTPSMTLKPGEYTMMLGIADDSVAVSKALKINVT